jgi:hypothetical protein
VGQRRPRAGFDWTNSTRLQGGASTGSFQSFAGIRIDDAASNAPAKERQRRCRENPTKWASHHSASWLTRLDGLRRAGNWVTLGQVGLEGVRKEPNRAMLSMRKASSSLNSLFLSSLQLSDFEGGSRADPLRVEKSLPAAPARHAGPFLLSSVPILSAPDLS